VGGLKTDSFVGLFLGALLGSGLTGAFPNGGSTADFQKGRIESKVQLEIKVTSSNASFALKIRHNRLKNKSSLASRPTN